MVFVVWIGEAGVTAQDRSPPQGPMSLAHYQIGHTADGSSS